jgi:hypothetical protein
MLFSKTNFGPNTATLMGRVYDDAWREIQSKYMFPSVEDAKEVSANVVALIMNAVSDGERDPERLKLAALQAIGS